MKEGIKYIIGEGFKRKLKPRQLLHPSLNPGHVFLLLLTACLITECLFGSISNSSIS